MLGDKWGHCPTRSIAWAAGIWKFKAEDERAGLEGDQRIEGRVGGMGQSKGKLLGSKLWTSSGMP
jgi:hypothetical protein